MKNYFLYFFWTLAYNEALADYETYNEVTVRFARIKMNKYKRLIK